ncbi:hypothetical protein EVAR_69939_1 [Eumeta japonica]|uniref:Uncharacterized protein n=1 Tax=Eumeta variegata TaxID=151549 RepID=A0A4C1T1T6_EUMVA|nr:hypothetical protein EVAR_69939_1 [Eumeta japonica]
MGPIIAASENHIANKTKCIPGNYSIAYTQALLPQSCFNFRYGYSPHSDLGRVVQAVIREFERFPPTVIKANSPINIATANSSAMPMQSTMLNPTHHHQHQFQAHNNYSYPLNVAKSFDSGTSSGATNSASSSRKLTT